jgi:PAS domain S-box-containing protein
LPLINGGQMESSKGKVPRGRYLSRSLYIVLVYLGVSAVWIGSSDTILFILVRDESLRTTLSIAKGMVFILLTSLLLYYLMRQGFDKLEERVAARTVELTNITEKLEEEVKRTKEAQAQLHREMEKLAVTLNSIGEGVVVTDTEGFIQLANRMAEDFNLKRSHSIVGLNLSLVLPLHDPRTGELLNDYWRRTDIKDADGGSKAVLFVGDRQDLYYNSSPVIDKDGSTIGFVVAFRDITSEMKLQEAETRAKRLDAIGQLAGDLAHSFNNALTSILGNIELLGRELPEGDARRDRIVEAQAATLRTMGLTNQLLTFAKGGEPIKHNVTADSVLNRTRDCFSIESKVELRMTVEPKTWMVDVDELQMSQALTRLLSYLAGIGDQEFIQVESYNVRPEQNSRSDVPTRDVIIKMVRPHHWNKSIRGSDIVVKEAPLSENQGIELVIANSIIERHGGCLVFHSSSESSICEVLLPACVEQNMDVEVPSPKKKDGKAKVLIMDDDIEILDVLSRMLKMLGHEVDVSKDGAEAIERYAKSISENDPFDVLIMDLNVPGGMGGKEAMKILLERFPNANGIVSSGYSNDPIMANFSIYGFKNVLPKPYSLKQLEEVVSSTM